MLTDGCDITNIQNINWFVLDRKEENIMSDTVYKIIKDKAGYYHITYDNCAVSFFHSIEDAEKELYKILKEKK